MAKRTAKKPQASAPNPCKEGIRIGTLVGADKKADYIRQILPLGFESFSLTWWQKLAEGENIRETAAEVRDALGDSGAVISSISAFGNPLDPAADKHKETLAVWRAAIDNAHRFGCNLVTGFAGRLIDKPIDASMKQYAKVFGPLAKRAADRGVKIAFENCDMGGTWNQGNWNIAHNPTAWEMMFDALPAENIGLQWEPCHQMVSLIDPMPQLRRWIEKGKIFHVHGKDATVDWNIVREFGVHGPRQFAWHRTPGFGDTNWTDVITILRQNGYTGSIDIEGWHDSVYKGDLEMTGQVHGMNYLKNCRGGTYVKNPK